MTSTFARQNYVKKVRLNNVDVLPIEMGSNKIRRNEADTLPIKITSKNSVKMTGKLIDIFFSTYRRYIDIESTSICRVVSVR